ncbi:MAG: hypothetical protein FJ100_24020 [Deltaproteobacteria bacterium]|nr:hypothetical protein [Deltaproteobacteria bacterium]
MSWPTPRAEDSESRGAHRGVPDTLTAATRWASPAARDYRSGSGRADNGHTPQLPEQVGARLHPEWVETLVGLPVGWTLQHGDTLTVADAPAWPAQRIKGMDGASPQHAWEPPRLVQAKTEPNRNARLKALGNAVVPQQAVFALARLLASARDSRVCPSGSAQGVLL